MKEFKVHEHFPVQSLDFVWLECSSFVSFLRWETWLTAETWRKPSECQITQTCLVFKSSSSRVFIRFKQILCLISVCTHCRSWTRWWSGSLGSAEWTTGWASPRRRCRRCQREQAPPPALDNASEEHVSRTDQINPLQTTYCNWKTAWWS